MCSIFLIYVRDVNAIILTFAPVLNNIYDNSDMRGKILSTLLLLTSVSVFAEGYQVNTFSPKQEGMGHVGVAMKLGAESNIFNPAAVSFSGKTLEISAGVSAISALASCDYNGKKYETDNGVSTPFNISAAFRIYDNLYAGISLYTPYGSSINWGENWPGAILNQSVDLKVFTVQPTVSWRILPNLGVGAGMMIGWGNVNLNKGLVTPESFDRFLPILGMVQGAQLPSTIGNVMPASVNLTGDSQLALGFNLGAIYDIDSRWTVGVSYRSKMSMKVKKGTASVSYANEALSRPVLGESLDLLNSTNFSAEMPCPYVLTFGVSYKPIEKLLVAFDAQLNGWSTYKTLDIEFDNLSEYDQHLTKDYKNSWTLHLGGQYALTERLDLRAGMMLDLSPVNHKYYNPETPGMTKIEPSVGLSFRPLPQLSIDAAFMYVFGAGVNGVSNTYDNLLAKKGNAVLDQIALVKPELAPVIAGMKMPETGEFKADYKTRAIIPAIGISYSF